MASTNFINECKKPANSNRLGKVTIGSEEINQSNFLSSLSLSESCYVDGSVIGTNYSKSVDVTALNTYTGTLESGETINPQVGVKYDNGDPEYINFGNYVSEISKEQQTSVQTSFTGYDKMINGDGKYVCGITSFPSTVGAFYLDALSQLGIEAQSNTFSGSTIQVSANPFTSNESIRDVLKAIEKVSCTFGYINKQGKHELRWFSNTIDYEFTKSDYSVLEGGNLVYGPINRLILGNKDIEGQYVIREDTASISEIGANELYIDEPYFLYNDELRNQAITQIWNKVNGFTYTKYDLTTYCGKPFLEIGNKIKINRNDGTSFESYVLSHTFSYGGSFTSEISADLLTKEEVEHKNNSNETSVLKQTEVSVNKQLGEISLVASEAKTTAEGVQSIAQDAKTTADEAKTKADGVDEKATTALNNTIATKTIQGSPIHIEDASNHQPNQFIVYGNSEQETRQGYNLLTLDWFNAGHLGWIGYNRSYDETNHRINFQDEGSGGFYVNSYVAKTGTYTFSVKVRANRNLSLKFGLEKTSLPVTVVTTEWQTITSTATVTEVGEWSAIVCYIQETANDGDYIEFKDFMEYEGTNEKTYEQYGAMPSPDYPSEIKNVGVYNIYDKDTMIEFKGYFRGFSNGSIYGNADYYSIKVPVEPNTKYNFHYKGNILRDQISNLCFFGKGYDSEYISGLPFTTESYLTTPDNCYYISLAIHNNAEDIVIENGNYLVEKIQNKNLIKLYKDGTLSTYGLDITSNKNGIVEINGTSTDTFFVELLYDFKRGTDEQNTIQLPLNKSKSYTLSCKVLSGEIQDEAIGFVCQYAGSNTLKVCLLNESVVINNSDGLRRLYFVVDSVRKIQNAKIGIQLEEGNLTNFETHKEEIIKTSLNKENLIKNINITNEYCSGVVGEELVKVSSQNSILYNKCAYLEKGKVYYAIWNKNTIKLTGSREFSICDDNNKVVQNIWYTNSTNEDNLIINCTASGYIYCTLDANATNLRIYEETSTPYWELNKIGDVKDEIDITTGVLTKRIGKIVFDGNEGWELYNVSGSNPRRFAFQSNKLTGKQDGLSNRFTLLNSINPQTEGNYLYFATNKWFVITDNEQTWTDVNDFKTWLGNNNVVVYYELATPETIQLDKTQFKLFENVNNISQEGLTSNMYVEYFINTEMGNAQGAIKENNFGLQELQQASLDYITTETLSSSLDIQKDGILSDVSKEYVTTSDFGTFQQTNETKINQKADATQISAIARTEATNVFGDTASRVDTIEEYFTFDTNGLTIGRSGSEMTMVAQNDKLSFKQGNNETAYFTSNALILKSDNNVQLQIGNFRFVPNSNGSLDFKKV